MAGSAGVYEQVPAQRSAAAELCGLLLASRRLAEEGDPLDDTRLRAIGIAVVVALLAIVVVVLWRGAGHPAPSPGAGQSLDNPFGSAGAAALKQGRPPNIPRGMPGMPRDLPPGV